MKFFVVLCCALAVATAKPNYAFTEVAPLTSNIIPYSIWGSNLAYSHPVAYTSPLLKTVATPVVSAAPVVSAPVVASVVAAPAVGLKTQYHNQDFLGQAAYGHVEPHQSHAAVQDAAGNKVGSFSYVKADGTVARTDYVADALGYRVASNDLPIAPIHAAVHPVGPAPVADTPEVVAARMAHFAEVEKAKSRSRRDVSFPASTGPLVHSYVAPVVHTPVVHTPFVHAVPSVYSAYHVPVVTPSGHIADTPEVTAAKIAHFAEHAAARARGKRAVVAYSSPLAYSTPLAYSSVASPVYSHVPAVSVATHPYTTAYTTGHHIVY